MKWLVFVMLVFLALPVFAQTASQIAVVDTQKLVQNSEAGKKAFAEIKSIKDKKQQEMDQRQDSIQAMQDKLEKQKDILSADAQEKLRSDIQKQITDLRRYKEDSESDIQNRLNQALDSMQKQVLPIIKKLETERGYAVILSKDALIDFNPKNDITDEVIRLYNEQSVASPQTQKK
ncbi:MAG TPA: OmpH family outer membrane protein [Acidobacteriota bacterium]|nr:OmpH family outer membrane protein [Acidobacteriota bacterium]